MTSEPNLDFRSDTVTKPNQAMRQAMAEAMVGDDCYGDDPTVGALERRVAQLFDRDAAVFLPSGTMSNQLAIALHTSRGDAMAAAAMAHVQIHEDASPARFSGVQVMPLGTRGGYSARGLQDHLNQESCGWPHTSLVWLENTIGIAGGAVWPIGELQAVSAVARDRGRRIHLDGARIWNAHVASKTPLPRFGALADTLSVCLSKGLGAPAGSLLVGDARTIARARALRHAFGGSMRQAGILAAAGLLALEGIDGLAEDHRRAAGLADAISEISAFEVQYPGTNMVLCGTSGDADELCAPLRDAGLMVYPNLYSEIRFVVHRGHDDASIEHAAAIIAATHG